ncbi:hypothetical protein PPIS_b0820 [Pseudoalteromonas piscicida]|uniref:Uncharacterized protein n=1 Tax=Pseudoalteromonas piscicida TaxID=43662 RepID=A0ABM6NLR1_PSEO7|nr:hypothetical protein PPIS_b0820 [Pseudoalteromonas piscicida]
MRFRLVDNTVKLTEIIEPQAENKKLGSLYEIIFPLSCSGRCYEWLHDHQPKQ